MHEKMWTDWHVLQAVIHCNSNTADDLPVQLVTDALKMACPVHVIIVYQLSKFPFHGLIHPFDLSLVLWCVRPSMV